MKMEMTEREREARFEADEAWGLLDELWGLCNRYFVEGGDAQIGNWLKKNNGRSGRTRERLLALCSTGKRGTKMKLDKTKAEFIEIVGRAAQDYHDPPGPSWQSVVERIANETGLEFREERDRLREELEKQGRDLVAARVNAGINSETVGRLAAENAGLRGALSGVKEAMDDAFRDAGGPGNHYTIPVCLFCGNEDGHQAGCVAPTVDRALASPSPLTQAVQRVLEAVGRVRDLIHVSPQSGNEALPPITKDLQVALLELLFAYDHLQAILEGKGEGA